MDTTDRSLVDELEELVALVATLDPADAVAPASRLAEILGLMLEAEEEH